LSAPTVPIMAKTTAIDIPAIIGFVSFICFILTNGHE